jgi:hypothetical protein
MLVVDIVRCAARTTGLLLRGHLHVGNERRGREVAFPNGSRFVVFRETCSDLPPVAPPVLLVVHFRLRFVPPGARLRRWLFERESILNTLLFAGCDGYITKLWMVNPATSEYAGMYAWAGAERARGYGDYITAVLRPLAVPGSLSYTVDPGRTLDDAAAAGMAA